uniref:Cytochrome P450 n=1 Tax=Clastoptera arizonana TaxID=38151 RepID=A0A1B6E0D8_9HEMI
MFTGTDDVLVMNQLTAQAFIFFLAGFETTSNTTSFCLYELALNQDVQEKLRQEVDLLGGDVSFDRIKEMTYLDMVVKETLRRHPPVGFLHRTCNQPYKIPGTDDVIDKGILLIVPIHGLHRDPEYFPEPLKFDPERFSKENAANIKPYSYLPFGEGPRYCIGMKFGEIQVKTGLVQLLQKFEFHVHEKTAVPVQIEPKTILSAAAGGMWLKAVPRQQ